MGLQVWVPQSSPDVTLSSVLLSALTFMEGLPKEPTAAKVHSKANTLRTKVTMVESYTTVFLKNIPQFVIPKQNKIMHHSEKLVSHSEDV